MTPFNLLFVEDDNKEIKTFRDTLERYCAERHREITLTVKTNKYDALKALSNSFDGAIVDLKLESDNDAGNIVVDEIFDSFRIPVAVYTGNPQNINVDFPSLRVFTRASVQYDAPLDFLFDIYNTGVTRILGGRGYIEEKMNEVFKDRVYPYLEDWKAYNAKDKDTEKALLRLVINHIVELVDEDVDKYFPEEMYIGPITSSVLKTGSIVKKREVDNHYVVLSPTCDLALHDGKIKTDRILVCSVASTDGLVAEMLRKNIEIQILDSDDEGTKENKRKRQERERIEKLNRLYSNSIPYFHFLPKTRIFFGGVVNFRAIETLDVDAFRDRFEAPFVQISASFTKDIVARFSSYYARQGQPDFDPESLIP